MDETDRPDFGQPDANSSAANPLFQPESAADKQPPADPFAWQANGEGMPYSFNDEKLDIGAVISTGWEIFASNWLMYSGLSLIVNLIPLLAGMVFIIPAAQMSYSEGAGLLGFGTIAAILLAVILNQAVLGCFVYGVFQNAKGDDAGFGATLAYGLERLSPILSAAIVIGVGICLGLAVFVIPGIILAILWCVAVPACAVEDLGAIASLNRSYNLTEGYRWQIFLLSLIIFVAYLVLRIAGSFVFGLLGAPLALILNFLLDACLFALENVITATLYFELREIKEGVKIDTISQVFE